MEEAERFTVEVVYARADEQLVLELEVEPGTTAEEAVRRSGLLERFPEIDLARNKLGVYGKVVKPGHELAPGDRVEVYRPLIADPKEVRKRRAAAQDEDSGQG
ncbi:RnfH family protein [Inmirania thermothiophila]|uniref:UPF0125 protein EDC57_1261 n=1 Tax=Inmirania thermothiophila TaxID=1750597 RepID=A0A3N1Y3D1_9GAMM|nr:RnfH family protein [Inmirania thermothiophila]ROR32072.1 hypothetical protein EDC57_1261 [Inmirania thermothiophila]